MSRTARQHAAVMTMKKSMLMQKKEIMMMVMVMMVIVMMMMMVVVLTVEEEDVDGRLIGLSMVTVTKIMTSNVPEACTPHYSPNPGPLFPKRILEP